jgi:hypothetical protein
MATKNFPENFERFRGLDLKSTHLTRDPLSFIQCTNTRFGEGNSLRKREGCQVIGQVGGFVRIHTHDYADRTTGAHTEDLLAINTCLWKLKTANLSVTSGTDINYSVSYDTSNITFRMVLRSGTTAYTFSGDAFINLGTGLESEESSALKTMEDLRATIDAHATLACALPTGLRFARINGAQNAVTSIVVDAGHNYVVGDWLTVLDVNQNCLVARKVSAVTATTVEWNSALFDEVSVYDNQIIGPMASPAAGIPLIDAYNSAADPTSVDIAFYYWDIVPHTGFHYYMNDGEPFREMWTSRTDADFVLPEFINANNVCYIYTGATTGDEKPHEGFPFKYDGQNLYREGLPVPKFSVASGVGSLSGVYQFKTAFVQIDSQGNEIIGRISEEESITLSAQGATLTIYNLPLDDASHDEGRTAIVNGTQAGVTTITVDTGHGLRANDYIHFIDRITEAVVIRKITGSTSTTLAINGAAVNVTDNDVLYLAHNVGFNTKRAVVDGAQSDVSTLTVENDTANPNLFDIGDTIYFLDRRRAVYTTRVLTSKTATTIGWSSAQGESVDVSDGDVITCNFRVRVYRTLAGGNIFYEAIDIPPNLDVITFTNSDADDSDATVGMKPRLIEPEIGYEPDLPPKGKFAVIHQGTRISSGDVDNPNTISVYDVLNVEGVPLGQNRFDIPSNIEGPITALASDTENSLAVFKPNAYYSINGDLAGGVSNIVTETEGDYGISSQSSVCKIRGVIFGVGNLGILAVRDRQLLAEMGSRVNSVLQNNPNIVLSRAIGFNDWTKRGYTFFVPDSDGFTTGATLGSYEAFFYDYENDQWFDDEYSPSLEPEGGMTIYGGLPYRLSRAFGGSNAATEPGHVFRGLRLSSTMATPAALYVDNHLAITRTMRWLVHMGTPSIDKEFLRIKLYSMYNPGEEDQFVTATITLKTYRNFQSSTADTNTTLTFTASTIFEDDTKLKSTKARAMMFEITDSTIKECFHFTGWQVLVALPYREEDIKR